MAFYYYPRGHALAYVLLPTAFLSSPDHLRAKGFYYGRKGEFAEASDPEKAQELHADAFVHYLKATQDLPEDDEQHSCTSFFPLASIVIGGSLMCVRI
ncbi:hypothetical protein L218DRAFT_960138 [Marasmius fiardii PR-910]|nr:hypothetical protein L218DRAFT_960138 [Marasmius fiardii PR-910]